MSSEHQHIESLLKQMPLNQPPVSLDQSVREICTDDSIQLSTGSLSEPVPGNGVWVSMFAVAMVASLIGFLLGQFTQFNPSGVQGSSVVHLGGSSSMIPATLTPVKFNLSAFQLLHRHSELPEFAECKDCHSEVGPPKAFEDWYYGDQNFFEVHGSDSVSNCSSCHTLEGGIKGEEQEMRGFKHFKDSDCSTCHVVGKKPR